MKKGGEKRNSWRRDSWRILLSRHVAADKLGWVGCELVEQAEEESGNNGGGEQERSWSRAMAAA